jgi:hypothetical protein
MHLPLIAAAASNSGLVVSAAEYFIQYTTAARDSHREIFQHVMGIEKEVDFDQRRFLDLVPSDAIPMDHRQRHLSLL